jgi:hypothetical protein
LNQSGGFLFDGFDVGRVELNGLVALSDGFVEIFHVEVTKGAIEVEGWVFGVDFDGFGVELEGLFVVG